MTNTLMKSMFQRVKGTVWDFTTGQIGVKRGEALVTLTKKGSRFTLTRNPLDMFSVKVPAWGVLTPVASLIEGDLIVLDTDYEYDDPSNIGFFLKAKGVSETDAITNATISVIDLAGKRSDISVADNPYMQSGVLVVKNIMSLGVGNGNQMFSLIFLMKMQGKGSKADLGKLLGLTALFGGGQFSNLFGNFAPVDGDNGAHGEKADNTLMKIMPMIMAGQFFGGGNGGGGGLMQTFLMAQMMSQMSGGTFDFTKMAPMFAMSTLMGESGSNLFGCNNGEDDEEEEEEDEDEDEEQWS